jgi:tRNA pseudouridine55 synthase
LPEPQSLLSGALLINKHQGVSSFGVLEILKKNMRKQGVSHPKLGHGGTLDPFATGLLIVCVGRGVKLSRYFLGSKKKYEATLRFGETTIPGDPTDPISETSSVMPESLEDLRSAAREFSAQDYHQIPPMHSAKKLNGKPLYELARQGIEVERAPKQCYLTDFEFLNFSPPRAQFRVGCSSGTYIRTLAQDFARKLGTVGMLDTLHRTESGIFNIRNAMTVAELEATAQDWASLPAFVPFDRLLDGFPRVNATDQEAQALIQGKQQYLGAIIDRVPKTEGHLAIYREDRLIAVAVREQGIWGLERVFVSNGGDETGG